MVERNRSRVPVKIEAAGDTDIGGRSHNEDAILLRPDLHLFMVADGAGGQNAGNVASSLATTSVAHFFEQTREAAARLPELDSLGLPTAARRLSTAIQEANKEILAIARSSDRHHGMGTTVVAALFSPPHRALHVAQVGDSRCYRLREGRLELLSHDHSLANDVLELRPDIDDARLATLPKNVITRALGMTSKMRVSMRSYQIAHGDRYLLCSDGLSDVVADQELAEVLGLDAEVDERVRLLMNMALDAGSGDNIAVIVIDCALSGTRSRTSTRPTRKLTPPAMPRVVASRPVRPKLDTITADDAAEIVHFQDAAGRDSSPMIHVVPVGGGTQDVLDAVTGVMAPGSTPPPAMDSYPGAVGSGSGELLGLSDDDASRSAPPPDSSPDAVVSVRDDGARLTMPIVSPGRMERGGAAAKPATQRYSAPRRKRPNTDDSEPPRSGQTRSPPGPSLTGSTPTKRAGSGAVTHETGGSTSAKRPKRPGSRPRGKTAAAKRGGAKLRLKLPTAARKERRGRSKPPTAEATPAATEALPTPEARDPMDTSELIVEETIECHACGSFISRAANLCMYCGAPTGFIKKQD